MNEKSEISEQKALLSVIEKRWRLRVAIIIVPGLISILLFIALLNLSPDFWWTYLRMPTQLIWLVDLAMMALSMLSAIMTYLQTGFKKDVRQEAEELQYSREIQRMKQRIEQAESKEVKQDRLDSRIYELENKINGLSKQSISIKEEDKEELLSILSKQLESDASKKILEDIEKKAKDSISSSIQFDSILERFNILVGRLRSEIISLTFRGNLNLAIGVLTTIIGLGLLALFVFTKNENFTEMWPFLSYFIPRLSLVLFIEIFAYFFLKLYKAGLSEIKYFQNEITNIEAKTIAGLLSILDEGNNINKTVIDNLANTERNFVLEKGQSTVEIERAKLEKETITSLSNNLVAAINKKS